MERFLIVCLVIVMVITGFAFSLDSKQDAQFGYVLQGNTEALGKVIDSQAAVVDKLAGLDASVSNLSASVDQRFGAVDDRLSKLENTVEQVKYGQTIQAAASGGQPQIIYVPQGQPVPSLATVGQ